MFGFGKKKDPEEAPAAGWLARLQQGLGKTRAQLGASLGSLFGAGRKLDEAFYEELETVLLTADVGVAATIHLLDALRARARRGRYTEAAQLRDGLREELCAMLEVIARPLETGSAKPFVIMLVGVIISRPRANPCCSRPAIPSVPPRASSSRRGVNATT
jgi:fused signal recognition particle receptor